MSHDDIWQASTLLRWSLKRTQKLRVLGLSEQGLKQNYTYPKHHPKLYALWVGVYYATYKESFQINF